MLWSQSGPYVRIVQRKLVNRVAILRSATLCKMEFVRVLLNGLSQVFQYLIQQLCSRALRCGVLRVWHGFMLEN